MELSNHGNIVLVGLPELETALAGLYEVDVTAETRGVLETFRDSTQAFYDSVLADPETKDRHHVMKFIYGAGYGQIICDSLRHMIAHGRHPRINHAKKMLDEYNASVLAKLAFNL